MKGKQQQPSRLLSVLRFVSAESAEVLDREINRLQRFGLELKHTYIKGSRHHAIMTKS